VRKVILLSILLGPILFSTGLIQAQDDTNSFDIKKSVFAGDSAMPLPMKSPLGALARSVVFPGGGQFYNRRVLKGSMLFALENGLLIAVAVEWKKSDQHLKNFNNLPLGSPDKAWEFELYEYYRDIRNLHLWCVAGVVFFSMMDAYVDAHLFNFEREEIKEVNLTLVPKVEEKQLGFTLSINF
jgi:hypothetical protein